MSLLHLPPQPPLCCSPSPCPQKRASVRLQRVPSPCLLRQPCLPRVHLSSPCWAL
jgi:hypothetical protein